LTSDSFRLPERSIVSRLALEVAEAGGRLLIVGGWVRDELAGASSKDFDLEVFGLSRERVSELVEPFGFSGPVGRHFPVWRLTREGVDVAYPRAGADCDLVGSTSALEPAFREASRHRDLTINAIGWDPIARELIDPWNGRTDLEAGLLRAVSEETFAADPLRVLRVARLLSRFDVRADPSLEQLCRRLDLGELASERIARELRRILCESRRPSLAFEFLARVEQIQVFEPLAALSGVVQDPRWHPEGDVYTHTCMVIDRAARIADDERLNDLDREILLFAALCHDLGKPETTTIEPGGRIRSHGHEAASALRARAWLENLGLGESRVRAIEALVANHLAPAQFVDQGAGARAYRRLARKLASGGVTVVELERVARADHLGRSTDDAIAGRFDAGIAFLQAATDAEIRAGARADVVSAASLMERGITPGPELGRLLARCREVQDETGSRNAAAILDRVMRLPSPDGS